MGLLDENNAREGWEPLRALFASRRTGHGQPSGRGAFGLRVCRKLAQCRKRKSPAAGCRVFMSSHPGAAIQTFADNRKIMTTEFQIMLLVERTVGSYSSAGMSCRDLKVASQSSRSLKRSPTWFELSHRRSAIFHKAAAFRGQKLFPEPRFRNITCGPSAQALWANFELKIRAPGMRVNGRNADNVDLQLCSNPRQSEIRPVTYKLRPKRTKITPVTPFGQRDRRHRRVSRRSIEEKPSLHRPRPGGRVHGQGTRRTPEDRYET